MLSLRPTCFSSRYGCLWTSSFARRLWETFSFPRRVAGISRRLDRLAPGGENSPPVPGRSDGRTGTRDVRCRPASWKALCSRDFPSRWNVVADGGGAVLRLSRSNHGGGDGGGGDGWELSLKVQVTSGDGDGGGSWNGDLDRGVGKVT
jgi:hypothetical protein